MKATVFDLPSRHDPDENNKNNNDIITSVLLSFIIFFDNVSDSVITVTLDLAVPHQISSTDYPENYPSDHYQEWHFTGPTGTHIVLTIRSHTTETYHDYVNFGRGHDSADMSTLAKTIDGDISDDTTYTIDDNEMWLYFVSDYLEEETGFLYDVTAVTPSA